MRILYICNYPLSGQLSPSVNERQFVATLERRFGDRVWYHLCEGPLEVDLPMERVSFFPPTPPLWHPVRFVLHAVRWAREAQQIFSRHRANLAVVRMRGPPLKELLLARAKPQSVIAKSVARYWLLGTPRGLIDRVLRALHRHIVESCIRHCLGVEAVTDGLRDLVVQSGVPSERVFVVSNSVDVETFRPSQERPLPIEIPPGAWPVIGYCGSWPEDRGGLEVVELVRRLRADFPTAFGVVAGRSERPERIRQSIHDAELDDSVAFPGWVPFNQLPAVLARLDLAVSFTPSAFLVGGNASMKIRQYIASGVPVLTHADSNDFIADEDLGSLVEQEDANTLEAVARMWIQRLATDRAAIRMRLHNYAREYLSCERALDLRLQNWNRLLSATGNAPDRGAQH